MSGRRLRHPPGLRERVGELPRSPGVYLLKDAAGKILYVGKATELRSRVRSYLGGADGRPHLDRILRRWHDVQVLTTTTVAEALVLENSLIKKERPPGNVQLRDDKRYLCLRVDLSHDFPRIRLVRRFRQDGALYFGPYASAKSLRRTLKALREIYPLRTCSDRTLETIPAPCLYYQLDRCAAPCHDLVSREDYGRMVEGALDFLRGRGSNVVADLRVRMEAEASELRFEAAARLRDRIHALERTLEKQSVAVPDGVDRDVVTIGREEGSTVAEVLFVRDGALVSARDVPLPRATDEPLGELLHRFLTLFYDATKYVPTEILVPTEVDDTELVESYLSELRGARVRLRVPQRGFGRELMRLAEKNVRVAVRAHRRDQRAADEALVLLAERLELPGPPRTMECFDVSHLSGREVVASLVRFTDGRPDKAGYRHFRVREQVTNDDFASMNEILRRRYREGSETPDRPDLIVVDGGKGQLSSALAALAEVGWDDPPLVALAKARTRRSGLQRFERVFRPGRGEPVVLPDGSPEMLLLARLRDETHRFAIRYHRKLRSKAATESALDSIEGVGEAWRRRLLRRFGSVEGIRDASLDELMEVPGIGRKRALRIREHLAAE